MGEHKEIYEMKRNSIRYICTHRTFSVLLMKVYLSLTGLWVQTVKQEDETTKKKRNRDETLIFLIIF